MSGLALAVGACSQSESGLGGAGSDAKASPTSSAAMMEMGDKVWASGDPAAAARFYLAAANAAPHETEPKLKLARALQTLGAHRAAISVYDNVLAAKPDEYEARRGLANALISLDRPREAVGHFEKVIAATGDYRAYNGLGVAEDMLGDHKAAIAAYKAGLAKQPHSLTLRNNYGLSLALAGHYRKATDVLHEVAADKNATARHRQNLALVYGLAGNFSYAAQIARIDLDAPAVARNLAYYAWLRRQPRKTVNRAIKDGVPTKLTNLHGSVPAPKAAPKPVKAPAAKPRKEAKVERFELQQKPASKSPASKPQVRVEAKAKAMPKPEPKAQPKHETAMAQPRPKAKPRLKETMAHSAPMQKSTSVLAAKPAAKPANAKAAAKTAARLAETKVAAVKPPVKAPVKPPVKAPVKGPLKTVSKAAPRPAPARADVDIWAMPAPAAPTAKAAAAAAMTKTKHVATPAAKFAAVWAKTKSQTRPYVERHAPEHKANTQTAARPPKAAMESMAPRKAPASRADVDIWAMPAAPEKPAAKAPMMPKKTPETRADVETSAMPVPAPAEPTKPAAASMKPEMAPKAPEKALESRADVDIWAVPAAPQKPTENRKPAKKPEAAVAAKTAPGTPAPAAANKLEAKPAVKSEAATHGGADDKTSVIVPLLPETGGKRGEAAPKRWHGASLGGVNFHEARLVFARAERGDGDAQVWIFPLQR